MLPTLPKRTLEEVKENKKTMSTGLPTLPKEQIEIELPKQVIEVHEEFSETEQEVSFDGTPLERRPDGRYKMPKSQYDSNGNPVLTIPNLDDVNLTEELDKFFK